jgi:hypothetical protein
MPRRFRQSQSNDHDLVPYTKYRPKSRLPSLYDQLRSTSPPFTPIKLDPITNTGPNLPVDHDLDNPIAYFRLFFTDNLISDLDGLSSRAY